MNEARQTWRIDVLSTDGGILRSETLGNRELEIGRDAKGLEFPDDAAMTDREARLRGVAEGVEVEPTREGSGVWVRVRESEGRVLSANDQIWVGSQILVVLRYADRWQLRHHGAAGEEVAVHDVAEAGVFVGRGSELVLDPTDRGLSRRHAQIAVRDGRLVLYDRGALNGTFLRLQGSEILSNGSEFRVAAQHLRVSGVPHRAGALKPDDERANGSERPSMARSPAQVGTSRGLADRRRALSGDRVTPESSAASRGAAEPSGGEAAQHSSKGQTALVVIDSAEDSIRVETTPGKTVLEAVQAAGFQRGAPIDWECLDGRCGVCVVRVIEGADRLDPPETETAEMRTIQITEQVAPDPAKYRLACLARVRGSVRLRTSH